MAKAEASGLRVTMDIGGRKVEVETRVVSLDKLTLHPANPRTHGERNKTALRDSLTAFGQTEPLVVNERFQVLAGNGRLGVMRDLGWKRAWIAVAHLEEWEQLAYMVADNRTSELAGWDASMLAQILTEIPAQDRKASGFSDLDIELLMESLAAQPETGEGPEAAGGSEVDDLVAYSTKVESPVYEPNGPAPAVAELYDSSKRDELIAEIDAAEIDEELRAFLRAAAGRHVTFRYDRIADFYPHATPAVQRLIENSALVVIDFKRAVELGFVRLHEDALAAFSGDYPDA